MEQRKPKIPCPKCGELMYADARYCMRCGTINTANESNIKIIKGNTVCTDCFDVYMTDVNQFMNRIPSDFNPVAAEMEAFALFYNAKLLNKNAACLMSVVDSKYITNVATAEERQTGLNNMIRIALDSAVKL